MAASHILVSKPSTPLVIHFESPKHSNHFSDLSVSLTQRVFFSFSATCGGTYFGQSGVIRSPGYPDSNYPDNSNCEWYLEGPTGHYLTLTYTALDLQSSSNCNNDYVEIREYNASGLGSPYTNESYCNVEGSNLTFSFHQVACWGNTVETAFHLPWILQTVLHM